jgi:hypothetical protein
MKSSKNNQAPRTALAQLPFGAIQLQGAQGDQFHATQRFLLELSTDTMLKPYRELAGLPAPGNDIGGWYDNFPTKWFGRGLPLHFWLEPVDAQHPNLIALVRGPLVLFALGAIPPAVTRAQLLRARRNPQRQDEWLVHTDSDVLHLRPFTAIDDESYTTYLTTTD